MRRIFKDSRLAPIFALTFSLFGSSPARATSATWNGATNSSWATTTNWSATPPPGTGDTATFGLTDNGHTTISLGTGVTVNTVQFDMAQDGYTIGAGAVGSETLTLNNGGSITLTNTVKNDQLFNAAVVLGTNANTASSSFDNLSAKTLTVAGNISGGAGGTAGTKTLTLNTGKITISGVIGGGGGTIAVTDSGDVTLAATNTFTGALTVTVNNTLVVPTVNNASANGPLG